MPLFHSGERFTNGIFRKRDVYVVVVAIVRNTLIQNDTIGVFNVFQVIQFSFFECISRSGPSVIDKRTPYDITRFPFIIKLIQRSAAMSRHVAGFAA